MHALRPLVALLWACGQPASLPEHLADCPDADCRGRWVETRWEADPQGVAREVAALPDPLARGAIIDQVSTTHPERLVSFCGVLPPGDVAARCFSLASRAHLWQDMGNKRIAQAKQGAAEDDKPQDAAIFDLIPTDAALQTWAARGLQPVTVEGCDRSVQECQITAAQSVATDADLAATRCLAIEDQRWRNECFFQAAEAAYDALPPTNPGPAMALCLGAGDYARHCLRHLTWAIGPQAPSATAADQAAWDGLRDHLTRLAAPLAVDPAVQAHFLDIAWANAIRAAYDGELEVTGRPLDLLPEALHPHVRAGAIWRLWNLEAQQPRNLQAWVDRAGAALAERAYRPSKRRSAPRERLDWLPGWDEVLPTERDLPRLSLLGMGNRTTATDPTVDITLCLLEAAARSKPVNAALLEEGAQHADPRVRWTAVRLLALAQPSSPAVARAKTDADPLVAARAVVPKKPARP